MLSPYLHVCRRYERHLTSKRRTGSSKPRRGTWPMSDQRKRLPVGELADYIRDEDLAGAGARADAAGELNGGAEEVALLGDGFAGVEADAHAERCRGVLDGVGVAAALDGDGALDRAGG